MEEIALNISSKNGGLFTSIYVVEQINMFRELEDNKSVLTHSNFLKQLEKRFPESSREGKIYLSSVVQEMPRGGKKEVKIYLLTYESAIKMLARESNAVGDAIVEALKRQQEIIIAQQDEIRRSKEPSLVKELFAIHRIKSKESTTNFHKELTEFFATNAYIRNKYHQRVGLFIAVHTDRVNLSLFGYTSKEWKLEHPEEAKTSNMRDNAPISTIAMIPAVERIYLDMLTKEGIYDVNELGLKIYNFADKLSDTYTYLDDAEELTVRQLNNREAYKRKLKFAFKRQEELPPASDDDFDTELQPA
jgi:hypothetical protein